MSDRTAKLPISVTALLSLAVLLAGCGAPNEISPAADTVVSVERAPIEIATTRVVSGALATTIAAAGSIRARRESAIGAEVSGRILSVLVDVGDEVAEGDALFQIDPLPFEMALSEARAELKLARAELENARAEESRVERLIEERAVSIRSRDQRKTEAAVAAARVSQMQSRVERASMELDRTVVRAPYASSVVERLAHEGAMAGPEPIVVLQESDALEVMLDIPEATLAPVSVGDAVRIFASSLAQPIETKITRVSDRVDPATRTIRVRAPLSGDRGILKAGSFVRAEVVVAPDEARPLIPRAALLLRDGRTYVFVVEQETVRRVAVRTGARTDEEVELLSGVAVGADVALGEVIARLIDGDRIRRIVAPVAATEIGAVQ